MLRFIQIIPLDINCTFRFTFLLFQLFRFLPFRIIFFYSDLHYKSFQSFSISACFEVIWPLHKTFWPSLHVYRAPNLRYYPIIPQHSLYNFGLRLPLGLKFFMHTHPPFPLSMPLLTPICDSLHLGVKYIWLDYHQLDYCHAWHT